MLLYRSVGRRPGNLGKSCVTTSGWLSATALACLGVVCISSYTTPAYAEIVFNGQLSNPQYTGDDPWFINGDLEVRQHSIFGDYPDALVINDGSSIYNNDGYIGGFFSFQEVRVTVTGNDSLWRNSGSLYIGNRYDPGVLNIEDQALVRVDGDTWVGSPAYDSGTIHFDNGTLETSGLYAAATDLLGTGTINTNTIVGDIDLVFNQASGLQLQHILNTEPDQNVTINIDASDPAANRAMGAGYDGVGSLTISDGISLTSNEGFLGYLYQSQGTANVNGANSHWQINESLYVGRIGTGTLNIEDGGVVTVGLDTFVGFDENASGTIHLDNGTLNTSGLCAATDDLTGTGTINTHGLVSDIDLIISNPSNLQVQKILNSSPDQSITLNLDVSDPAQNRALGAGFKGNGSLTIAEGVSVSSTEAMLGYHEGSNGTVTIAGANTEWLIAGPLQVGYEGNGTLSIGLGAYVQTADAWIANRSDSVGTLAVRGVDSQLITSENLYVGERGNATMSVEAGGFVHNDNAYVGNSASGTGTVTVSDADSLWQVDYQFSIGHEGAGELTIHNGGQVLINEYHPRNNTADIGFAEGASGSVLVTGIGSTLQTDCQLNIGSAGTGVLDIQDGATLTTTSVRLGSETTGAGTVNVTGTQSTWTIEDEIVVGKLGLGELNITNGGSVTGGVYYHAIFATIGGEPDATGTVLVDGAGSHWDMLGTLSVGMQGTGTLSIANDAVVNVSRTTTVAEESSATGTINFVNGTLNTAGLLASTDDLLGTGTIETKGIVSDISLQFDQTTGPYQQLTLNTQPNQYISINIDATDSTAYGTLGAGYRGFGSLTVSQGVTVNSSFGILGDKHGSYGTAAIQGQDSRWYSGYELTVGNRGIGAMGITDGASAGGDSLYVGREAGSYGSIDVSDSGSTLYANEAYIGYNGTASLDIRNGALLSTEDLYVGYYADSHGTLHLAGSATSWNTDSFSIGSGGSGILTIQDGAQLEFDEDSYVGQFPGGHGELTVTGAGSSIGATSYNDLNVGYRGTGILNIENEAYVRTSQTMIGGCDDAVGIANVSGPGTVWDINHRTIVACENTGVLNISDGAVVNNNRTNGSAYIGYEAESAGTVTVSDTGSQWNIAANLYVGYYGNGMLNIEQDASVSLGAKLYVSTYESSTGTVNLNGGTLDLNGNEIYATGQGAFNFTDGTLKHAATIDLKQPFIQNGGTLAPGGSIGQTNIIGDYQLTAGNIEIQLDGITHDYLSATGDIDIASLDTTLNLSIVGSVVPGTYTLIESTAGTLTGQFENIIGLDSYPGTFDVQYTTTSVILSLNALLGDLNADGFIGLDDLDIVLLNWNQSVTPWDLSSGDTTGDGYVGLDDLDLILSHWNQGTPPSDSTTIIPEPNTLSLLFAVMISASTKRRRIL